MEALVVFTNENEHWMGKGLHPEFRHVYCVLETAPDVCTEINLTGVGVQVKSYAGTPETVRENYSQLSETTRTTLVRYDPAERSLLPHALNNCVGLTKQLLGFRVWALTPYQLYRAMYKEKVYAH